MLRKNKLQMESLERRTVLAADIGMMFASDANADASAADQLVQVDTSAAGDASLEGDMIATTVDASADANADASLPDVMPMVDDAVQTIEGAVGQVGTVADGTLDQANDAVDNVDGMIDDAAGNIVSAVDNAANNLGDAADNAVNNVDQTLDDALSDVDGTLNDAVGDVTTTADGVLNDLNGTLHDATENLSIDDVISDVVNAVENDAELLVTEFLGDLGQATGTSAFINSLSLDALEGVHVSDLADQLNLNGLINSGGRNINGFLHSLSNHVDHLADDDIANAVDHVFARFGNLRGALR
jgi:hypothetical protein